MDASKLREKVYIGYGKAAKRIGYNAQQFRATSAFNPLATAALQSLPASFTTNYSYSAPNKYGQATWLGVFDGRAFLPGDYLVSPEDGTFFVAAMQTTLPILLVSCNRTISILRPSMGGGPGAIGYGGDTAASEVPIMTNWPCSMLQGSKGEKNEVGLPADAKNPWFNVLLPYVNGVTLRTADIITDDLGGRYKLTSAELTDLGWRLTAQQVRP
ncbi:hypothetical protein [Pantoea stewartii]|uniref:Uncharacterized protein n=1 Tax=Pantoea stewartii subsp. stewartii DC283 TaxID=660596 RepID=H3RDQ1_PANSE|nr:hypothetical protein [Pantoea stewartii]ARF50033.1 hypothetical protein DSJ_12220 [Pantoea stewartii subsp. stewartii DC283]EHU00490.1 hypothetical protein CKS_2626 [Pantoea stewartii subsp. stewartii DC283]